jgi:hypothetical protein
MAGVVQVVPAGVNVVSSVVGHYRATVTNVAGNLESFITGGVVPVSDGRGPSAVYLGVEPGAGDVYVTWDGQSTPAAALGFKLGPNSAPTYIPIAPDVKAGQIKVIATVNPTYVQVKYEWSA